MEVKIEIDELLSEITWSSILEVDQSFQYAKICSIYLRDPETENYGRRIIVNILNKWLDKEEWDFNFLPEVTHPIWADLVESAGFYPYLEKEKDRLLFNNLSGEIRKETHLSEKLWHKYLHEEQRYLRDILLAWKNLIVSAPTSFWKSLLIEEMVASKKYKNIVVIQPTLALLDETRRKMKKYSSEYKIIIRTSQEPSETRWNLFLLTSERVLEYSSFPKIDLLIIDEFYKLSTKRDDERADHLNNAFYILLKRFSPQFYLLWPNIKAISEWFSEKYNAIFYRTNYSLIDNQIIDIYSQNKEKFNQPKKFKIFKENILFDLLFSLKDEQTIIYCSSPNRVRQLASKFSEYLKEKNISTNEDLPLIEWIGENITPKWNLILFLRNHIGINDWGLQKHINSSMVRYFNEGKLKYIFCTSTIIEWVNTSAKNVVIFDWKKWRGKIDYFDYSNIKGRAWRMMIHYIGKIYDFNSPPQQEDTIIDIPFFEQSPNTKMFSPEMEIWIEQEDIKDKTREQYKELNSIPKDEKELIRKNWLSVNGQRKIIEQLTTDITDKYNLIWWSYPNYEQLKYILELAWDNLLKKWETTSPMTKLRITKLTFDYGINKDIKYLIQSTYNFFKESNRYPSLSDDEIYNEAIRESFQILRHWFQYKVPKWLGVMSELQKYVCENNWVKPWNYTVYGNQIENDFIKDNLTILFEFWIPKSAIEKIWKFIHTDTWEEEVLKIVAQYLKKDDNGLIKYEIETIKEVIQE